jgi:hypothetical protein
MRRAGEPGLHGFPCADRRRAPQHGLADLRAAVVAANPRRRRPVREVAVLRHRDCVRPGGASQVRRDAQRPQAVRVTGGVDLGHHRSGRSAEALSRRLRPGGSGLGPECRGNRDDGAVEHDARQPHAIWDEAQRRQVTPNLEVPIGWRRSAGDRLRAGSGRHDTNRFPPKRLRHAAQTNGPRGRGAVCGEAGACGRSPRGLSGPWAARCAERPDGRPSDCLVGQEVSA